MSKRFLKYAAGLLGVFLVLSVPFERDVTVGMEEASEAGAFVWGQDSAWYSLEEQFRAGRPLDCSEKERDVRARFDRYDRMLDRIEAYPIEPSDPLFDALEREIFGIGPWVGNCVALFREFSDRNVRMRRTIKSKSVRWEMNDRVVRERMYRLLYGARATAEEVMLQLPQDSLSTMLRCENEPSAAPHANLLGERVHSGDILVSRGGAPTSALIARGNDFPGNFSHIALVHVDSSDGRPTILESHIERGVTMSTVEEYLADKKLRVMVLRLRHDLPVLEADPMLPHRAAQRALNEASKRHIPYDFAMDAEEPSAWFCSELATYAYRGSGVRLWMGMSTISSTGLRSWLGAFGVRIFTTQEPSDLEYDPQLVVVAEWRDPRALWDDHLDNAVTEVMLEGAERGDRLEADILLLPFARTMKVYSWVLNLFGFVGPIPEGMSAEAALKNNFYSSRHDELDADLRVKAEQFEREKGYRPPYWRMLEMVREAMSEKGMTGGE